jgi:hypothetical protein
VSVVQPVLTVPCAKGSSVLMGAEPSATHSPTAVQVYVNGMLDLQSDDEEE